ncbi:MAG: sulfatase-like hydrolase/transferase [Candidatus Eisenbacteria bacterium]|nr:sulfatase-like hydrolase/transferase [Candidatus Eisenbacteria bacterium]
MDAGASGGRDYVGTILCLLLLGAFLGGAAGLVETGSMPLRGIAPAGAAGIVNVSFFYAVIWAVVGLVLGCAAVALSAFAHTGREAGSRRALFASLLTAMAVYLFVGSYVNVELLPTMFSLQSILFDVVLLGVCLVLWLVLFRLWRRAFHSVWNWRRSPLVVVSVILLLVLIVTGSAGVRGGERGARTAAPTESDGLNVVLVLVDALRADHLGCYGYSRQTSPNVDRLAGEGVLFTRAYSQAPRTKESTASMVTSLYPSTHGMSRLGNVLPESATTLTEAMKEAGYATAIFAANPMISPTYGFGRGVDHFYTEAPSVLDRALLLRVSRKAGRRLSAVSWLPELMANVEEFLPMPGADYPFEGRDAARINGAFLEWVDGLGETPFFAYLHYMEPHTPYEPPAPFDETFDPGYEGPKVTTYPEGESLILPFVEGKELPEQVRRNMVAQYDGSIAYFDEQFEDLLAGLRRRGLEDETLIVFTSDHGEEFFEHRGWGHGHSLHEELIRVPLIMWCPGSIPAGETLDTVVRHVDLMPTLLGAAGTVKTLDAPEYEGVNLWTMLRSRSELGTELPVFAEVLAGGHSAQGLVKGTWKIVLTRFGAEEHVALFDLSGDPDERVNLSSERGDIAEALLSELLVLCDAAASRRGDTGITELDEETEEKLRALGYVQ